MGTVSRVVVRGHRVGWNPSAPTMESSKGPTIAVGGIVIKWAVRLRLPSWSVRPCRGSRAFLSHKAVFGFHVEAVAFANIRAESDAQPYSGANQLLFPHGYWLLDWGTRTIPPSSSARLGASQSNKAHFEPKESISCRSQRSRRAVALTSQRAAATSASAEFRCAMRSKVHCLSLSMANARSDSRSACLRLLSVKSSVNFPLSRLDALSHTSSSRVKHSSRAASVVAFS